MRFRRSGAANSSNYYSVKGYNSGTLYNEGGAGAYYGSSTDTYAVVSSNGHTAGDTIVISGDTCTAIWGPLTPTAAITLLGLVSDVVLNGGTVTWSVSDDGTTWVSVPTLSVKQAVNFDQAALYVKCVITGSAVVKNMAVGGI